MNKKDATKKADRESHRVLQRINKKLDAIHAYENGLENHPEFNATVEKLFALVESDAARAARAIRSPVRNKKNFILSQLVRILRERVKFNYNKGV